MSVYKRGRIYWVKFQASGTEIRQSARTTSKRDAHAFEKALRLEYAQQTHYHQPRAPATKSYADALLRWVETEAPKSMLSHARNTRPYLDTTPLHRVPAAVSEMKADMVQRGLSPQTINRRLAVVKRVLHLAYAEWDWIKEPLSQKIKKYSEKGYERQTYLSKDDVTRLVDAITNETAKKIVLLAAYTGLRKSEILRLTPENWQAPYITLKNDTKSKRARSVPVITELHGLIQLPFRITPHELRKAFEHARTTIQRPDIRFHDLRHTFASWLAKDPSIPLLMLRDLLGHSTLSVTSKYSHLRGEHHAEIERVLGTK